MNRREWLKWLGLGAAAAPVAASVVVEAKPARGAVANDRPYLGQMRAVYQCVSDYIVDPGYYHYCNALHAPTYSIGWAMSGAASGTASIAGYEQWNGKEWVAV